MRSASEWRKGSKRNLIGQKVEKGLTRREIFAELKPMVAAQVKPMVFAENLNGRRVPLDVPTQYLRLWAEIGRVMSIMTGTKESNDPMPENDEIETPVTPESVIDPEPIKAQDESPEEYFVRRTEEVRAFCRSRAEIGEPIDEISNRPARDGVRAIREGVSPDAMLHAMTLHWPEDTRREAGIPQADFEKESAKLAKKYKMDGPGFHKMAGLALAMAKARVPCMLVGPAGSGKSYLAKQVADELKLNYAECPLTAGATPSWLLGAETINGFKSRPFLTCFEKGGVFNFEEIDAADPNMLLVANQALAADEFFNPANGEIYEKHTDNVLFSTANTFGLGATRAFTARERLDAATIDRWRMGRIFVDIDEDLARYVALNQ